MWFIGQFENGSWGFQQEGCPKRYTSQHEAECIRDMYEALKGVVDAYEDLVEHWMPPESFAMLGAAMCVSINALSKAEEK